MIKAIIDFVAKAMRKTPIIYAFDVIIEFKVNNSTNRAFCTTSFGNFICNQIKRFVQTARPISNAIPAVIAVSTRQLESIVNLVLFYIAAFAFWANQLIHIVVTVFVWQGRGRGA